MLIDFLRMICYNIYRKEMKTMLAFFVLMPCILFFTIVYIIGGIATLCGYEPKETPKQTKRRKAVSKRNKWEDRQYNNYGDFREDHRR